MGYVGCIVGVVHRGDKQVILRKKVLVSLGGVLFLVAVGVCFCIAYWFIPPGSRITDDYYLLRSSTHGASIGATWTDPGTIQVIGPEVVDLDWNEDAFNIKNYKTLSRLNWFFQPLSLS